MSTLVINLIKGVIAFLSGRVPDRELYPLILSERYCLREATGINRADLLVVETSLAKTKSQRGLAHASYSDRSDLFPNFIMDRL